MVSFIPHCKNGVFFGENSGFFACPTPFDPPFCVVLLEQFFKRAYAEMDSILANTAVKLFI